MKKTDEKCILVSYIDKHNMRFLKKCEASGFDKSSMVDESIHHFERVIEACDHGKNTLIAPINNQRKAFLTDLKEEGYSLEKILDIALSYLEKNFDHAMEWEKY